MRGCLDYSVPPSQLRRLVSGFYIVEWTIYNDIAQVDCGHVDVTTPTSCVGSCDHAHLPVQYQVFESSTNESKFRALETANNVDNVSGWAGPLRCRAGPLQCRAG